MSLSSIVKTVLIIKKKWMHMSEKEDSCHVEMYFNGIMQVTENGILSIYKLYIPNSI